MKKITLIISLLAITLLFGCSVSAQWENLTPSAWSSYDQAFATPTRTPSAWNSYSDAFATPTLRLGTFSSLEEAFATPTRTPSAWNSYADAFATT